MNSVHLRPTDVLFFRDGRPMEGSSAGHGASWPMPNVLNAAFHAALHRAGMEGLHHHRTGRSSNRRSSQREQIFGSLLTVGPFPVDKDGGWYFPRPADAQRPSSTATTALPMQVDRTPSSLDPSLLPVVDTIPPSKTSPESWLSREAWEAYLTGENAVAANSFLHDNDFSDTEHQISIGIEKDSQTAVEGKFFSANYLRLREDYLMGMLAEALDKKEDDHNSKRDLIQELLSSNNTLIVGGQQKVCSARCFKNDPIPLPLGPEINGKQVRWTLLTPAVFPQIDDHPGGWLPNWIDHNTYELKLLDGPGRNKARRAKLPEGTPIEAKLVGAIIPEPIPVTGFATGVGPGAKSAHLAVPAGSVYYFQTDSEQASKKLARALNWHGLSTQPQHKITNRRSTIFGEKGFGIGLCSNISFLA